MAFAIGAAERSQSARSGQGFLIGGRRMFFLAASARANLTASSKRLHTWYGHGMGRNKNTLESTKRNIGDCEMIPAPRQ
jgi:hypothetical protein